MKVTTRLSRWLEHRWVNPAYGGWVLLGLATFFFAAATNTLAGWLYVMSGVMLALLLVAAVLPPRHLYGLEIVRSPLPPVTAPASLEIELQVRNGQRQPKGVFQVIDRLPTSLGGDQTTAVEYLGGGESHTWRYRVATPRRGIYRWSAADLRTAAPLGLFWCRRTVAATATAVVYPQVLPLKQCPLLTVVGQRQGQHWRYNPQAQADTQGVTRALRPYRWGDPTRLIHWRTSARYGELRVRELETMTASHEVVIALNTAARWDETSFEQAVVAAASLYTYAVGQGFTAALWLPPSPRADQETLLRDTARVMYALADVMPAAIAAPAGPLPQVSTLWLTAAGSGGAELPSGSRCVIWGQKTTAAPSGRGALPPLWIDPQQPLDLQLQAPIVEAQAVSG